ncbi:restriction endonuclease subunit S [Vibrio parahaemolyticus]|nr:restriction endonuclease subunit S [Vibrio parahaemolyticus]MDF5575542.1 restriction endonuclease subunit S [Vibrio parahaemolyticus]MDG2903142.1 restriction endonuclease subunit S [Vibrio parahaemolyticus]
MSWPLVKLGEIVQNCNAKRVPLKQADRLNRQGCYDYYGASGVIDHVDDYIFDGDYLLIGEDGNNLISRSSPIAFRARGKFWVNNHAHILAFNGKADLGFLVHYINSINLEPYVTGSAQPKLNKKNLDSIQIPLPPLEEQKRIAAILDKADAIRQKRKQAIELADEFLHSVFLDMFGDPVTNPKGWEQVPLSTLSDKILNGTTPKGGSDVYVEKGIAFLRSQNVWKKRIDLDDIVYLDDETHAKMSKSSLKHKDILITKTGRINTENSSLGRAAIYRGKDDEANINGHVYLVRLKPDNVHEFIEFILTTKEYRDHIRAVCVGGIDKRQLNKNHIEEFPIICPPSSEQQRFVKILHQSQKVLDNYKEQLVEAQNNFSALTQKAFSGQL